MPDTITNENGQFRSAVGPKAIDAYRLRVMITALKLYQRTGMQPTRGVNIVKMARAETDLPKAKHEQLIAALTAMLNDTLQGVTIVTDGVVDHD